MKDHENAFQAAFFSWLDSYDIYAEDGSTLYTVKGELALGNQLRINDAYGYAVGYIKEQFFTLLPRFSMYMGEEYIGCIRKEFTLFTPRFSLDMNGWTVVGDWLGWDYEVCEGSCQVATVGKELAWTDTYVIDVHREEDALTVLMIVLAIDAVKCSANK